MNAAKVRKAIQDADARDDVVWLSLKAIKDPQIVEALIEGLSAHSKYVRWPCAEALGKARVRRKDAVEALRAALAAGLDEMTCPHAIEALGELGAASATAVPEILAWLQKKNGTSFDVHLQLEALAKIGCRQELVIPFFRKLLRRDLARVAKDGSFYGEYVGLERACEAFAKFRDHGEEFAPDLLRLAELKYEKNPHTIVEVWAKAIEALLAARRVDDALSLHSSCVPRLGEDHAAMLRRAFRADPAGRAALESKLGIASAPRVPPRADALGERFVACLALPANVAGADSDWYGGPAYSADANLLALGDRLLYAYQKILRPADPGEWETDLEELGVAIVSPDGLSVERCRLPLVFKRKITGAADAKRQLRIEAQSPTRLFLSLTVPFYDARGWGEDEEHYSLTLADRTWHRLRRENGGWRAEPLPRGRGQVAERGELQDARSEPNRGERFEPDLPEEALRSCLRAHVPALSAVDEEDLKVTVLGARRVGGLEAVVVRTGTEEEGFGLPSSGRDCLVLLRGDARKGRG